MRHVTLLKNGPVLDFFKIFSLEFLLLFERAQIRFTKIIGKSADFYCKIYIDAFDSSKYVDANFRDALLKFGNSRLLGSIF